MKLDYRAFIPYKAVSPFAGCKHRYEGYCTL